MSSGLTLTVQDMAIEGKEAQHFIQHFAVGLVPEEGPLPTCRNQMLIPELLQMMRQRRRWYPRFLLNLPNCFLSLRGGDQELHNAQPRFGANRRKAIGKSFGLGGA